MKLTGLWSRPAASLVILVAALSSSSCAQAEAEFQNEADIFRLRHLEHYARLIEEYRSVTGRYPLEGSEGLPIWVFIAHDRQLQYTRPGPGYEHVRVPFSEWVSEVEAGLGREIDEFYDPQFVPTERPNFYTYVLIGDQYYLSVHVATSFPFATLNGPTFYKVALSNRPGAGEATIALDALLASEAFRAASSREPPRGALMLARDDEFRHYTKTAATLERERVVPATSAPN